VEVHARRRFLITNVRITCRPNSKSSCTEALGLHCQHPPPLAESERAAYQANLRGVNLEANPPTLECAPGAGQFEVSDLTG
jgi:hypothetical protein